MLDPACGDGRFLAATKAALAARGFEVRVTGVDIDLDTVGLARSTVPEAEIVHDDALAMDWGDRRFDIVIGNPPFLNQLASATTRGGRSRFGGGPYADTAAEFLALAVGLAHPGGRVGLVLPQSLLTTRDAGPIRDEVIDRAALRSVWWSPTLMFDAHVRTCTLVFEVGGAQGLVEREFGAGFAPLPAMALRASWGALLGDQPPVDVGPTDGTVGDRAAFAVDFRDQYYGLVGAVSDEADGPPLITSGLIEPGRCLWGERPARFAKQRFAAPRVDLSHLSPRLQRWAAARLVPKILIANQTRVIEAVVDEHGEWLPSVPVITATVAGGRIDALHEVAAVLSSPLATAWVVEHAAGSGLSAHSVRLTPRLLASIPWPA